MLHTARIKTECASVDGSSVSLLHRQAQSLYPGWMGCYLSSPKRLITVLRCCRLHVPGRTEPRTSDVTTNVADGWKSCNDFTV